MPSTDSTLADWWLDNPPIIEAVAGVEFRPRGMDAVRLVEESAKWRANFPIASSRPALIPSVPFMQSSYGEDIAITSATIPLRIWLMSEDATWVIQTQDDRLLLNWRKQDALSRYPKYQENIRPLFSELLQDLNIPDETNLVPKVIEFTYVNFIPTGLEDFDKFYGFFQKPKRSLPGKPVGARFESVNYEELEIGLAQVSVAIQPMLDDEEKLVTSLTLSTKIFLDDAVGDEGIIGIVDCAHELSKAAFRAVVTDEGLRSWGGQDVI